MTLVEIQKRFENAFDNEKENQNWEWVALEKSWTLVKFYIGERDVRKKKKNHSKDEAGNCRKDV